MATAPAFTLVEVLAALGLASLLLAALMAIATTTKRSEMELQRKTVSDDRAQSIARLLRADITLAHRIDFSDDRLVLDGYGTLDAETLEPSHAPALVTYGLAAAGDRRALVRVQQPPDAAATAHVVAVGVERFRVERIDRRSPDGDDPRRGAVRLHLTFASLDGAITTIDQRIELP